MGLGNTDRKGFSLLVRQLPESCLQTTHGSGKRRIIYEYNINLHVPDSRYAI